jgi:hypothetical protein
MSLYENRLNEACFKLEFYLYLFLRGLEKTLLAVDTVVTLVGIKECGLRGIKRSDYLNFDIWPLLRQHLHL